MSEFWLFILAFVLFGGLVHFLGLVWICRKSIFGRAALSEIRSLEGVGMKEGN